LDEFAKTVKIAPEVQPKRLLIGSTTRPPVSDLHPSLSNLDRTAYLRRKVLKGANTGSTFERLATFEQQMGITLFRSVSFNQHDGHLCIQTDFMTQHTMECTDCMQSDSVHGFITDDHFKEVNVTFTSAYCPVIQRTIPFLSQFYSASHKPITRHISEYCSNL
jgi:hypothetical protein